MFKDFTVIRMLKQLFHIFSRINPSREITVFLVYTIFAIIIALPILGATGLQMGHSIDWTVPNNPILIQKYFDSNYYVWWDNFLGQDRQWYVYNFLYNYVSLLPAIFFDLNGGLLIKFYIVLTIIFADYLFFKFSKKMLEQYFPSDKANLISFLVGLFYGTSAFKANLLISGEFFGAHFGIVVVPLFFFILLRYIGSQSTRNLIYTALTFVALLLTWVQYIILIFPIIVVLFVVMKKPRPRVKLLVTHIFLFSIIGLSLTSWFVPILLLTQEYQVEVSSNPLGDFRNTDITFPVVSAIFDTDWSWHYLVRNLPILYPIYVPIVGLMLTSILLEKERKAHLITITLGFFAFLYLGMASGLYGPLSQLLSYLEENNMYPIFLQLLRSPVGFLLGYHILLSVLLIFGLRLLFKARWVISRTNLVQAVIIGLFVAAVLIPHSIWYTSIDTDITKEQDAFPDLYAENPELLDFYKDIASEEGTYRILIIPPTRGAVFLATEFQHARPYAEDPMMLWSPKQSIDTIRANPFVQSAVDRFVAGLSGPNLGEILYYLGIYDIKYIVVRNDVNAPQWSSARSIDKDQLNGLLSTHADLFTKVESGRYIDVYEFNLYEENRVSARYLNGPILGNDSEVLATQFPSRIEPPHCRATSDETTSNTNQTIIRIDPCNDGYVSIAKPFLVESNEVYKYFIANFSASTNFYIKLFFQELDDEIEHGGIADPIEVHGKDAYYFYTNNSNISPPMMANVNLEGYFDTFHLYNDTSREDGSGTQIYVAYVAIAVESLANNNIISYSDINVSRINGYGFNGDTLDLRYSRANPTLWNIQTNSSQPFVIDFSESYSPWWEATIYEGNNYASTVTSLLRHDGINSFIINSTGNLNILIEYKPQEWFETGLTLAGVVLTIIIIYLALKRVLILKKQHPGFLKSNVKG